MPNLKPFSSGPAPSWTQSPGMRAIEGMGPEQGSPQSSRLLDSYGGRENLLSKLIPILLGGAGAIMAAKQGGLTAALTGFGKGFAESKLKTAMEDRQRKIGLEDFQIKRANDAVNDLRGLDLGKLGSDGKVPKSAVLRVKELMQKHNEALMNDGLISPKEAAELNSLRYGLESEISSLKKGQLDLDAEEGAQRSSRAAIFGRAETMLGAGDYLPGGGESGARPIPSTGGANIMRQLPGQLASPMISPEDQRAAAMTKAAQEMRLSQEGDLPQAVALPDGTQVMMPKRIAGPYLASQQRGQTQEDIAGRRIQAGHEDTMTRVQGALARAGMGAANSLANRRTRFFSDMGVDPRKPEQVEAAQRLFDMLNPPSGGVSPPRGPSFNLDSFKRQLIQNIAPGMQAGSQRRIKTPKGEFILEKSPDGRKARVLNLDGTPVK